MPMSQRDRIRAVYQGRTPDVVPFMLDLSHWFYHRNRLPWDLSQSYKEPERALLDYHKRHGVGLYMPNLGSFFEVRYGEDVRANVAKSPDGRTITWTYETPLGVIRRTRLWEDQTYAWAIPAWGVQSEHDLRVLGYAMASRTFTPRWDRYRAWNDYVGTDGVIYLPFGYSAMGHLLHYWLGVQGTIYAAADWHATLREVVDQINENNLQCMDLLAQSPAEVIIMGDNFSSDVQPPAFFDEWSRPFYAEALRRLHAAGKWAAVHTDGKLRGTLRMFRELGADCADAVTPKPMGDLTPEECRAEAGPDMILSGGISPDLWLPDVDVEDFRDAVRLWLNLKKHSARLIANAGDQVPPGAVEERIAIMRDLVEIHGRFS